MKQKGEFSSMGPQHNLKDNPENTGSKANTVIFIVILILISIPCILFLIALAGFIIRAVTSGIN